MKEKKAPAATAEKKEPALNLQNFATEFEHLKKAHTKLRAEIEALKAELKEVKAEAKKATAAGSKAEAKPKVKEKLVTPEKAIEVNGKEYVFTGAKVRDLNGNIILTRAIVEKPDDFTQLLEHLVNSKSVFIKELEA